MTALLISHSFARESTEHLTGCGKKIYENFVAMLRHTMQKIASHCKLICSQIDKTVSSTKISGMLLCCKKKNSIRGEQLIAARNNNVFCLWF